MQLTTILGGLGAAAIGFLLSAGAGCAAEESSPMSTLAATSVPVGKTLVVTSDGSGQYKTVQDAVDAVPANNVTRFVIRIKAGKYEGQVIVPKNKPNVVFEGEGAEKTILSWSHNDADPEVPGTHFFNPGVHIQANDFRAANLTFENTAGDRGQALALLVSGDRAAFENCRILGWQDTLLLGSGRQYLKNCYIAGRVDFIYGPGTAVFDTCEIHSKNGGHVTAANTPQETRYGFVFLNCKLTGDPNPWVDPATGTAKSRAGANADLGRPWGPYASVAFINCEMGDHISPEGWNNWGKPENEKTARYAEYGSKTPDGTLVDVSKRVPWAKQLTAQETAQYTITNVLGGTGPEQPFGDAAAKPIKIVRTAPPGVLLAQNAAINGTNAQLENNGDNIGYWTNTDTRFAWAADVQPGTYKIALIYGLDAAQAGSELEISVGDKSFKVTPAATGGWGNYKTVEVGEVEIKQTNTQVTVSALSQKGNFIMNLRGIKLIPAATSAPQSSATLVARDVEIQGPNAQLENDGANIGFWNNTGTQFAWQANLQPGVYRVALNYALDGMQAGSEIQVKVGDKAVKFTPAATGGWGDFKVAEVGEVEIKPAGPTPVVVSALSKKGDFIMNIREVTLTKK